MKKARPEPLTLSYDDLVIGGSLEALYFAYTFNFPVVYAEEEPPYYFENHSIIGNKLKLWNNLDLLLNLGGKNPLAKNCKYIYFLDDQTLKIITENETKHFIKFKRLWIYNDTGLYDIPTISLDKGGECQIVDQFKVINEWSSNEKEMYRDDKIIQEIHFFKEKPHSRNYKLKNFYTVSKVSLNDVSKYPEYLIKIRSEKLLGNIKTEHITRDIKKIQPLYPDTQNIFFCYSTFEEMYPHSLVRRKITYLKYLKSKLKL